MLGLAVFYNVLRELPFILFAVKTLRVSLCFWPTFNTRNVENLNKTFVKIMRHEIYFIYICLVYVLIMNFLVAIDGVDAKSSAFVFEFFCPRASSTQSIVM